MGVGMGMCIGWMTIKETTANTTMAKTPKAVKSGAGAVDRDLTRTFSTLAEKRRILHRDV